MPVVRVSCLPAGQTQRDLKMLYVTLVSGLMSVKELDLKESAITCLFPSDLMTYGLGDEIIIEIFGLFIKEERTDEVRNVLASRVAELVKRRYPESKVECFIMPFDPKQGFCVIKAETIPSEEKIPGVCFDDMSRCPQPQSVICADCKIKS